MFRVVLKEVHRARISGRQICTRKKRGIDLLRRKCPVALVPLIVLEIDDTCTRSPLSLTYVNASDL